jgi:hypothetical protein
MTCPSCHQKPTTFLRNAFSLQGVTVLKNIQGYFKCQHCGTLLRIAYFGKYFWYFYIPTIILLTLLILLYRFIYNIFSINPGIVWVALVVAILATFGVGVWKYAEVEKVDDKTT